MGFQSCSGFLRRSLPSIGKHPYHSEQNTVTSIVQNAFIETMNRLFPGSVTGNTNTLDNTIRRARYRRERFSSSIGSMSSKAVPYFVKLMGELFPFSRIRLSQNIMVQRNRHLSIMLETDYCNIKKRSQHKWSNPNAGKKANDPNHTCRRRRLIASR